MDVGNTARNLQHTEKRVLSGNPVMKSHQNLRRIVFALLLFTALTFSCTGCHRSRAIVKSLAKSMKLNDAQQSLKFDRESERAWLHATGGGFDGRLTPNSK